MRRYTISRTGIVRRGVDLSSRRRNEHASRNRNGTLPSPIYLHGIMSSLGSGGARPIAPPETLYAPSHGGGSAPTSSHGGGCASSSSQGPLQLEPWRPKEGRADAAWGPGEDARRITLDGSWTPMVGAPPVRPVRPSAGRGSQSGRKANGNQAMTLNGSWTPMSERNGQPGLTTGPERGPRKRFHGGGRSPDWRLLRHCGGALLSSVLVRPCN